jgi:hypothetical protein
VCKITPQTEVTEETTMSSINDEGVEMMGIGMRMILIDRRKEEQQREEDVRGNTTEVVTG